MCISRLAIIRLIKKDRNKRTLQVWRPIYFLIVDLKVVLKPLSGKLKKVLPDLVYSQQKEYFENRHIGERGRLISAVIEIVKKKMLKGFLVTVDI